MKWHKFSVFSLLILFLSACASVKVAKEKTYGQAKNGNSVVYFYRESHFSGGATSYNVWENEATPNKLGALKNGSYFYSELKPGKYTFFVNGEVRSSVDIDVKPNQTYYVQCSINVGFWAARPKLTEVTENEGQKQIKVPDMDMTEL